MNRKILCFFTILLLTFPVIVKGEAKKETHSKIEMLSWEQVNKLLPKYTKFIVRDLETGKEFRVQRRAGSQHADVQPLTAKDTKIMKEIYSGKWSWKRRAIIVIYKRTKLAASMHGMPHGAGALKNNFPGHFCIHFYGSTTHRRNYMDLSHQLMIYKAAGSLPDYLANRDPYETVSAFIAGMKQQDPKIVSLISLQKINWNHVLPKVENVAINRMPALPSEDLEDQLYMDVSVEVDWFIKAQGREHFNGNIHLVRYSPLSPWYIDTKSFLENNRLL